MARGISFFGEIPFFMVLPLANIILEKYEETRKHWQQNVKINHIILYFVPSSQPAYYQQVTNTCHFALQNGPF